MCWECRKGQDEIEREAARGRALSRLAAELRSRSLEDSFPAPEAQAGSTAEERQFAIGARDGATFADPRAARLWAEEQCLDLNRLLFVKYLIRSGQISDDLPACRTASAAR